MNDFQTSTTAAQLLELDRVLVIGHRGYRQLMPENTLPAFQAAIDAGSDLIELDYHHASDGVPVVIHDASLGRTTDVATCWGANVAVADRTARDIVELDAGGWFAQSYAGTRIPTLKAALEAISPRALTLIERKSGDAATGLALLREMDLVECVVVQSFDWEFIRECQRLEPTLVTGCLGPVKSFLGKIVSPAQNELSVPYLDEIASTGARAVGWNNRVSREAVSEAHQRGLKVWIYTINTLESAQPLLDMGVDGLITDNPGLMWKALALHQRAS